MTKARTVWSLLGLVLLALGSHLLAGEQPMICLAEVPSLVSGRPEPVHSDQSFAAVETLGGFLQAEGVFLLRPTEKETAPEAMASVVDLNAAALFVGVRSVHADPQCIAAHAPGMPEGADTKPIVPSSEDLTLAIRQAEAIERSTTSHSVAAYIASAVPVCPGTPDQGIEHFLSASRGPTIVVEMKPGDDSAEPDATEDGRLLQAVAGAIHRYFAEEPHNKWMHQTKRFD